MWIDNHDGLPVGYEGFLIETTPQDGASRYALDSRPAHTNQSREPRLYGWCGSYNNTSTSGCGLAVIRRLSANGERASVRKLAGAEAVAVLERLGYPELADDVPGTKAPGRPRQGEERLERVSIMLSEEHRAIAERLGEGSASAGIRRALEAGQG